MNKNQIITISDGNSIKISAINDVLNYEANKIVIKSENQYIILNGEDFYIKKLDTESGEVHITGNITSLSFCDNEKTNNGILKIFKK